MAHQATEQAARGTAFPGTEHWGISARRSLGSQLLTILGGSWVAISRVISRVTILITRIRGL